MQTQRGRDDRCTSPRLCAPERELMFSGAAKTEVVCRRVHVQTCQNEGDISTAATVVDMIRDCLTRTLSPLLNWHHFPSLQYGMLDLPRILLMHSNGGREAKLRFLHTHTSTNQSLTSNHGCCAIEQRGRVELCYSIPWNVFCFHSHGSPRFVDFSCCLSSCFS